jgi:DNA repair exonuclease SbcCD ATPase subunit
MSIEREQTFAVGENESPATVVLDQEKVESKEEVKSSLTTTEDLEQYSDKVQKRIDKLTARLRETERREAAALDYARQVQARMAHAEQQLHQTNFARVDEAKGRIDTQSLALKQIIKKAREEHDIDTETEAQERLTALLVEQQKIREVDNSREAAQQQLLAQQEAWKQQQERLLAQAQQAQQQAQVDPRAEEWAERNEWFGQDAAMTASARAIHLQMVTKEGYNPSSDLYYQELDRRIRETFPTKFSSRGTRHVQTVAPASRSSGINASARRVVKLTPSQVAIAKKLGVPLEEYAKYVKD